MEGAGTWLVLRGCVLELEVRFDSPILLEAGVSCDSRIVLNVAPESQAVANHALEG